MSDWKSEKIDLIATALNKAQSLLTPAIKDRTNPHFNSRYADLASVWEAVADALNQSGLAVCQLPLPSERGMILRTVLTHTSGQWLASDLPMTPDLTKPQAVGSALTYARRYGLSAMLGVYQDDDDAEAATDRSQGPSRHAPEPRLEERPAPRATTPYPSRSAPAPSGNLPTSGRALFAWLKDQEKTHGSGLVDYINNWAKQFDLPPKMIEWHADIVDDAVREALNAINNKAPAAA